MRSKSIPTSVRLDHSNRFFLRAYVKNARISESEVINKALDLYRKYRLGKDISDESLEDIVRDQKMAEEDFESYQSIVHEAEAI